MVRPILLVEDDTNDIFFFQRAAKIAAIANPVRVARDGEEAMNYLGGQGEFADRDKHPLPCLIVLDLNMPKKNGFELLAWLRDRPPLDTLPVVILTSSQAERDMEQALDLGAKSYVVKPSDPNKLVQFVKSLAADYLREQTSVEN